MKNYLKHLLFVFAVLNARFAFSQTPSIDSLLRCLQNGKADTNTINTLNALSFHYFLNGDGSKGLQYAENALSLSKKINFKKGEAQAYLNSGNANAFFEDLSPAIENYLSALALKKELKDTKGIAEAQNYLGSACLSEGNYVKALHYFTAVLKSSSEGINAGNLYLNIGHAYTGQNNFKEALKNYLTALEHYKKINDAEAMSKCYTLIGNNYIEQKLYQDALNNYFVALDIEQERENKKGIAKNLNALAKAYVLLSKFDDAIENYESALKFQEETGDLKGLALSHAQLGNLYTLKKKKNNAKRHLIEALRLSLNYGDFKTLSLTYLYFSRNDSVRKEKEDAKKNYELYLAYADSIKINWKLRKEKLEQLKIDLEKLMAADSLKTLEKSNVKGEKKVVQKIPYLYEGTAIIILLMAVIFTIRIYRKKRKKKITPL